LRFTITYSHSSDKVNRMNRIILILGIVILVIVGCDTENYYFGPVRKDVDAKELVSGLRKDSLFYSFKGYGVTPRDERFGIYLVSREKEKGIYHWVKFNPNGTKFKTFYKSYINDDSVLVKLSNEDSLEILSKAHELISICKRLELRWAGWEFGRFDCYFNDSTRMTYVEDKTKLDSNFYRFHKNLNWIDSNFATYY